MTRPRYIIEPGEPVATGPTVRVRVDPETIWTEHLTDRQLQLLIQSGEDPMDGRGFGVELQGGAWKTARSLVGLGLGWIEGDPGGELPGLFFNNAQGVRVLHEFDDEEAA